MPSSARFDVLQELVGVDAGIVIHLHDILRTQAVTVLLKDLVECWGSVKVINPQDMMVFFTGSYDII